jgi:hypothetical protein
MNVETRRGEMPMQTRLAPIEKIDEATRVVSLCWSTGARVKRYDWERGQFYMEELSMQAGHVRLDRLNGGAPLLDTHNRWSLRDVMGVVEEGSAKVDGVRGAADVRFSKREEVEPIFRDVKDKIIRNVSAGYVTHRIEILPPDEKSAGLPIYRAIDWEPLELSLVPIGADAGAGVRADEQQQSQQQQRKYPCEFIDSIPADPAIRKEETSMKTEAQLAAEREAAEKQKQEEQRVAAEQARKQALEAEQTRVTEIRALARQHELPRDLEDKLLAPAVTVEKAREMVLAHLSEKSKATEVRGGFAEIYLVGDEGAFKRAAMAGALLHRVDPLAKLEDASRDYRYLSLREMARVCLEWGGVSTRGMTPMQIAERSLMGAGDFTNLLADVLGKRLRAAYVENQPTYTRWARRAANAPDFKDIKPQMLSNAPDLQAVPAGAEFKTGSLSDGKETYAVTTYGRVVSFTRQAIINDDLRAFERFPSAFAGAARRLENRTVYGRLLNNANMADGVPLFHATHANLPAAAAIAVASLTLARALMRKQKGLQLEELNIAPKFLLCGPDKEQEAYQFTSSQYVPAQSSNVNEFRAGGRTSLEPIVDAVITGNKWFLAADTADCDTVEYCYLDGSEGVYLETRLGFSVDGVDMKARLDFAAKEVDYRGLVYNSGA